MGFIFSKPKPPSPPPQPAPAPAPAPIQKVQEPAGDVMTVEEKRKNRRRGLRTVLTGEQTYLGATAGKALLG